MATGFQSWKIAKGLYIVPLMFAYTPLISGNFIEVMQIGIFALFGIYAFNALVQNYAEGPLKIWFIPVLILGAVGAFWPLNLMANIGGAILVIGVIMMSKRHGSEDAQGVAIAQN